MTKAEELQTWIREQGDFSSKPDTATFYSRQFYTTVKEGEVVRKNYYGDQLNRFSDSDRASTIQRTLGGQELKEKISVALENGELKKEHVLPLWVEASVEFAAQAEGRVRAFTENAKNGDIFLKHELPTLLNNDKVTEINGFERTQLMNHYERALADNKHLGKEEALQAAARTLNSLISPLGVSLWDNSSQLTKLQEVGYSRVQELRQQSVPPPTESGKEEADLIAIRQKADMERVSTLLQETVKHIAEQCQSPKQSL